MRSYYFRWKRSWFWRKEKVIGHKLDKELDKMVLYLTDGSVREIKKFSDCEAALGVDWVLATKADMEKVAGQSIPLNVDLPSGN